MSSDCLPHQVSQLASHSWEKTLALLLRYVEAVPPEAVVTQLDAAAAMEQASAASGAHDGAAPSPSGVAEGRLFEYLHALFLHDVHLGAPFHGRQLVLYARHQPTLLLPFLKVRGLPPEDRPCMQGLMLESSQGDLHAAIDFVRQRPQEVELWQVGAELVFRWIASDENSLDCL